MRRSGCPLARVLAALAMLACVGTVAGQGLTVAEDGDTVAVRQGSRVVLRYRWKSVPYKPYVQELATPGGVNVLRDAPADHLHHHGLMFAVRADGVNFWEETTGAGREVHEAWVARELLPAGGGQPARARLHEKLAWQGPEGRTILTEERVLTLPEEGGGQPRVLTWVSTLTAPRGGKDVVLSGSNYFGLGARFLVAMDKGGRFINARGGQGVAETLANRAEWCAYSAEARAGQAVTLALLDSASNPRAPARWFAMERPFAYLAVTLGLESEPLTLKAGESITLRYGAAVLAGAAGAKELEAVHAGWQKGLKGP